MRWAAVAGLALLLVGVGAGLPAQGASTEIHNFNERSRQTVARCENYSLRGRFTRDLHVFVDFTATGSPFRVRTHDQLEGTVRNTSTGRREPAQGSNSDTTLLRRSAAPTVIDLPMRVKMGRSLHTIDAGELEVDPEGNVEFDGTLDFSSVC